MPEYILDETGAVLGQPFNELSEVAQGYIETMFFTESDSSTAMVDWDNAETQRALVEGHLDGTLPLDAGYSDIAPTCLQKILKDCADFESKIQPLEQALSGVADYDRRQMGRDLWFTSQGHGVGFWDREQLENGGLGDKLSEIADKYPTRYVYFYNEPSSPTGYGYVNFD